VQQFQEGGVAGKCLAEVAVFSLGVNLTKSWGGAFLSRLYSGLSYCEKFGTKKGGVNKLKKLRSGAKRNGVILTSAPETGGMLSNMLSILVHNRDM
jgi:hypothetical protein